MDADDFFMGVFLYLFLGICTTIVMSLCGVLDDQATIAECIAVTVFWPVFALKYLGLGIWAVLTAFVTVLGV